MKMLKIDSCRYCPHGKYDDYGENLDCVKTGVKRYTPRDGSEILENCPLDDSETDKKIAEILEVVELCLDRFDKETYFTSLEVMGCDVLSKIKNIIKGE